MPLFSGLNLFGSALQGYTQGLGLKFQRGINQQNLALAQQKQAGELGLQQAQSDYYEGRNPAALAAAQARATAMGNVASIKAGTAQAGQRDKALQALPGNLANLYYQSPEVVDAYTKQYDQQNGTNLNSALFGGQNTGMPAAPSVAAPAPAYGGLGADSGPNPAPAPALPSSPLTNPLQAPPLVTAKIGALAASANNGQNKSDLAFRAALGVTPPAQQGAMVTAFNARNGTNYPVPGALVPPPNGALGPPSQVQPVGPNLLQSNTLAKGNAQIGLDKTLAGTAVGGLAVKQDALHQSAAYQNGLLALRARGLTDSEANAQLEAQYKDGMLAVSQGNLNLGMAKYANPNAPAGASRTASTAAAQSQISRNMQRASTLQALMVKKDANGNLPDPSTVSAYQTELRSIQQSNTFLNGVVNSPPVLPVTPGRGGYGIIPGVGSRVPIGTPTPFAPPLPQSGGGNKFQSMTPQQRRALAVQRGWLK